MLVHAAAVLTLRAVAGVLNTVHAAPRIMYMRAFASLFAGRPSGLHVRNIILAAPRFNSLLEEINATIAEDFAAARDYVRVFEAVRMIHDHQLAWDKDVYEAEVGFDARRVRLDLRKFRSWKAELDRMKVSQASSFFLPLVCDARAYALTHVLRSACVQSIRAGLLSVASVAYRVCRASNSPIRVVSRHPACVAEESSLNWVQNQFFPHDCGPHRAHAETGATVKSVTLAYPDS